eukprot:CAMPEP_0113894172 /NCGR_PEP_ID=MMETSP0780_2-20120614/16542_1 /TAXON_ID=652834 /ORGANISM="Palpitomonas bilix" /LENGTH=182 /DNA_ID=CAMNT_0000884627 /DNA_START=129 /DNA_END=677 /DNA_ORIENTATION=- /assembly_acc=CAM_ASM_000599
MCFVTASGLVSLEYDAFSSRLFAVVSHSGTNKVMRISLTSGTASDIASLSSYSYIAQGITALHEDTQVLFLLIEGRIIGVSVRDSSQTGVNARIEQPVAYGSLVYNLDLSEWSSSIVSIELPDIESKFSADCCDDPSGCDDGGRLYACVDNADREWTTPLGDFTLRTATERDSLCDQGLIPC